MDYTLLQKNNAITAYLGGPKVLKPLFFSDLMEEEFHLMGLEDLRFHKSWDWLMPVWKKVNKELASAQDSAAMFYAMSKAIDAVDIEKLHSLISVHCINWCKVKQITL